MKKSKTHIVLIDTALFFVFIICTMVSPPTQTAVSQSSYPVRPVNVPKPITDSTNSIIKVKLDSLESNTNKLSEGTKKVEQTTVIMKKQNKELRKHAEIIKEIDNKLKYDSLQIVDQNKVTPLKKNPDSIAIEICNENLQYPSVSPPKSKRNWIQKIFGRKNSI